MWSVEGTWVMLAMMKPTKRLTEKQKAEIIQSYEDAYSGFVVQALDPARMMAIDPKFPNPAFSQEFAYGLPPSYFEVKRFISIGRKNQVYAELSRAYYAHPVRVEDFLDPTLFEVVELPKVEIGDTFECLTSYNKGRRFAVTNILRSHVTLGAIDPKPQQRNEVYVNVFGLFQGGDYRAVNRIAAVKCRVKAFKTRDLRYKLRVKLHKTTPNGQEIVWIPEGIDERSFHMMMQMLRFGERGFGMHPALMMRMAAR